MHVRTYIGLMFTHRLCNIGPALEKHRFNSVSLLFSPEKPSVVTAHFSSKQLPRFGYDSSVYLMITCFCSRYTSPVIRNEQPPGPDHLVHPVIRVSPHSHTAASLRSCAMYVEIHCQAKQCQVIPIPMSVLFICIHPKCSDVIYGIMEIMKFIA